MQKVLTAAQMREVDRLTTERYGIPSIILMENAAHAVARVVTEKLGGSVKGKSILILCGPGNNGGDGAVLARILWQAGAKVHVFSWGRLDSSAVDASSNFEIIRKLRGRIFLQEIDSFDRLVQAWNNIRSEWQLDAIVDAVFGTGLSRPLDDDYRSFLDIARDYTLDRYPSLKVAVDIPSGLRATSGCEECPFEADVTVTFTAPKPETVLAPWYRECGELTVANIGSPADLIDEAHSNLYLSHLWDAKNWLWNSRFFDDSYKNKRGHSLIIGGSENYSGAPVMCGNAAMRSGVGLVTLCVPGSIKSEVASRSLPEVIVQPIREAGGELAANAFDELEQQIAQADSITLGPGLSVTDANAEKLVRKIVENRKVPVVVDAGALWFYSPMQKPARSKGENEYAHIALTDVRASAKEAPLILTPHEGEFLRLLGTDDKDAIKDRVAAVRDFATEHNVILVLKGERVLIGAPNGDVVVNPTGNSGLGKAGNGDTLAGILAGFTAQASKMNIDIFETVVAAVYIAGIAGDIAEKKYGKRVMTASDVRECMVDAFDEVIKAES